MSVARGNAEAWAELSTMASRAMVDSTCTVGMVSEATVAMGHGERDLRLEAIRSVIEHFEQLASAHPPGCRHCQWWRLSVLAKDLGLNIFAVMSELEVNPGSSGAEIASAVEQLRARAVGDDGHTSGDGETVRALSRGTGAVTLGREAGGLGDAGPSPMERWRELVFGESAIEAFVPITGPVVFGDPGMVGAWVDGADIGHDLPRHPLGGASPWEPHREGES